MCGCTKYLFACLFVCFFILPFCLMWRGLSRRSRQWAGVTMASWQPSFIYGNSGRPGRKRQNRPHTGERPPWSSCSVLKQPLCSLLISSIIPPHAASAKSEASAWGQLRLIWHFRSWKGRGGGLERLEAAYLPHVLTARQECKSGQYGRIRPQDVRVCGSVLSVWGTFRVIT